MNQCVEFKDNFVSVSVSVSLWATYGMNRTFQEFLIFRLQLLRCFFF